MMTKAVAMAMACGAALFGCSTEDSPEQEIIDNLIEAGFPRGEISVVEGVVYVGNDAAVTLQASREMIETGAGSTQEHYRTTNLVSSSVGTICVEGTRLTGVFSTALDNALANYNALGLSFQLRRISGSSAGCDAVITGKLSGPVGGSSGFPSGGLPYDKFNIGSGLKSYDVKTIEHVITHELGHTIGFRHTDYFDRSISCGSGGNEGDGGIGAILIPGTPSGATLGGSVMNSCFRAVESGDFTSTDVTALRALY
jgi:Dual-action HEIGH metallo-peptidase